MAIKLVKSPRRVMVVGGGPAGMQAAIVAAQRGHRVVLYEKEERLGGQFRLAALTPGQDERQKLIDYFERQLAIRGVEVHVGQEASAQTAKSLGPEVVVVAAGSVPDVPKISGVDGQNVVTAVDVLDGQAVAGDRVIVVGGGTVGCETAAFIAEQGKDVVVVDIADEFCRDLNLTAREVLLRRLNDQGVKLISGTKVVGITGDGVRTLSGPFDALPEGKIEGDTIVLATGTREAAEVAKTFAGTAAEVHIIGDCEQPGTAMQAIDAGFRLGVVL